MQFHAGGAGGVSSWRTLGRLLAGVVEQRCERVQRKRSGKFRRGEGRGAACTRKVMVAQFEVAASGSIIFESRIAGMVCREIGIGPGTSSSQLVKSQKCNIRSVRLQMFTVSRNGERARFPLEA